MLKLYILSSTSVESKLKSKKKTHSFFLSFKIVCIFSKVEFFLKVMHSPQSVILKFMAIAVVVIFRFPLKSGEDRKNSSKMSLTKVICTENTGH